ncbi:HpcH/HpaI aldolase/citrate lyase family protein [Thalassospira sp. TSL5-1]|uniref:HpcH/HpaI aldolase family protein n=1 Tax=Thalassospira sp. TSL5-1 TaxID=1544451 RepID=UPI00096656D6|nr:aldolase/citrate lyase family protein [Thalassospira sp. TSL5-1]OKH88135.1 2,4-dihydroxyhept-2-ene-1,7-dioic acid aldolase [Thalassospira sp. TSL5-1]
MTSAIPLSRSLRERLLSHEQVQGAFLFLASPDVDEIMALAGFGALIVDREHAASDLAGALAELRAIRAVSDVPVLVRVGDAAPTAIKPLLDAGFDGIVVADVRSARQAQQIVEAAHYPPLGRRGAQFTVSRAAGYGQQRDDYVEKARRETLVVAMIESREGVDAIAEIAAVAGIDMLFIGPLDLTSGYGPYGDLASPEIKDAIAQAEQRIIASGCLLGGAAIAADDVPAMFARGYGFVTAASDTGLLVQAAKAAVRS